MLVKKLKLTRLDCHAPLLDLTRNLCQKFSFVTCIAPLSLNILICLLLRFPSLTCTSPNWTLSKLLLLIYFSLFVYRCQCGHCNVPSSPLNSPVTSLPPFKPGTSHSKVCSHSSSSPARNNLPGQLTAQWTNPVTGSNFDPHLLISNELHGIPSSQLLPPALMMNGLGNTCHCPACSGGTTGYREGAKNTEQVILVWLCSVFAGICHYRESSFKLGRGLMYFKYTWRALI